MKHHTISDEECYRIFCALDTEHQGRIHLNEFVAAALQEKYWSDESSLRTAFQTLDKSNTGTISSGDLKAVLGKHVTRERALEMIKAAELEDHGDDHRLSWLEFLEFVRKDGENDVRSAYERLSPGQSALHRAASESGVGAGANGSAAAVPGHSRSAGSQHAAAPTAAHHPKKFSLSFHLGS